eukprot:m.68989 g.68989  ORF g.68989 m.68989 type:complete len:582 (-) comp16746_c0_seq1:26-1771(-)
MCGSLSVRLEPVFHCFSAMDDLVVAAEEGNLELVKDILSRAEPATINLVDVNGYSCLHYACSSGSMEMVEFLLDSGASLLSMNNKRGQTPLHCACNAGHSKIVRRLVDHADFATAVNSCSKEGKCSALHCAAYSTAPTAPEIVQILLEHGAECNTQDVYGNTPLIFATRQGKHSNIVRMLLNAGADPLLEDDGGVTALHYAAFMGKPAMVEALLAAGAAQVLKMHQDPTEHSPLFPLYQAARGGFLRCCELLLDAGAPVNQATYTGKRALHAAADSYFLQVVRLLLERGADINATDETGISTLSMAASRGWAPMVELLLEFNADPNLPNGDHEGMTPLITAAQAGRTDVVQLLAKHPKTEINATDSCRRTALHWASFRGNEVMVNNLIKRVADMNLKDKSNNTPIMVAEGQQHQHVVSILKREGAQPNTKKNLSADKMTLYWVRDKSSASCPTCQRKFSKLTNRRHHCRICANLVCGRCSSQRLPPEHAMAKQRVCTACFSKETRKAAREAGLEVAEEDGEEQAALPFQDDELEDIEIDPTTFRRTRDMYTDQVDFESEGAQDQPQLEARYVPEDDFVLVG